MRARRVAETFGLPTRQDQSPDGFGIAWSPFQKIPQVQCAQLILVRPDRAVVAHRDDCDAIGGARAQRPRSSARRYHRCGVETVRPAGGGDDALRPRTCPLGDGGAAECGVQQLGRRVAEIEPDRLSAPNLTHAHLGCAAASQRQGFLDRTDHDDLRGSICQRYGSSRESAEHVDDRNVAPCPLRTSQEAINQDFQGQPLTSEVDGKDHAIGLEPEREPRSGSSDISHAIHLRPS